MNGRAVVAALVLAASGLFAATAGAPAAQAAAGGDNCVSGGSGGTSGGGGGTVSTTGQITMWETLSAHAQAAVCPGGTTSGGNSNWTPPQCWWGPEFTPDQLAADIAQLAPSSSSETYMALDQVYAANGPNGPAPAGYVFKNEPPFYMYNENVSPAGEWWGLIWNEDITLQGIDDCTAIDNSHFPKSVWYWVSPATATPEPGDAPTLNRHELALYLEGKVKLEPLPIQTDPSLATTKATVGLPTWVWATGAGTKVQDELCTAPQYGNICVQMTATAQSFTVSSSDPGATLYTDCKANADGSVGTPYTGQSGNPPCGVTFSQPGNWTLDMVTTWNVELAYDGGALNDPAYTETDLNANVQEVQAINNGGPTTAAAN
jgi:enoyl reductase